MNTSKIYKRDLGEACEEYIKIFGANKNLYRIMAGMIDGLKPAHRRFIYTLYKGKGRNQFIKMAKAAADTTAMFHPHGSASIEDIGAKLASPIANNICVVEGQGNFGSYKNEKAGASRYIECKLSKYALKCFFEDFENSNVDMKLSYAGDDYEPEYLPARYPHALFNPQLSGIGYGLSSNIPGYNLTEVMEATIKLIKNPKEKIYLVPDSPTGADIVDDGQFDKICETGIGTFTLRGSIEVDEINNIITITSIPLQTTIDAIIKNIVLLKDKKIFDEIVEIKDYTKNETGVKTLIYLESTANPYNTINKLYSKNTGLKKTYPVVLKMVDDYVDYDYGVKSFLLEWIEYRRDAVRSSYNTRLVKAMENQNINDIMLFITNATNAARTMKLASNSRNKKDFAESLMSEYDINSQQANTVAGMSITAFTKDAHDSYVEKKQALKEEIQELEEILDNDEMIDDIIIEQLKEGIKLFGSPRKSKIVKDEEEEVADTNHIVGISSDGYIKKVPENKGMIGQVGNTNNQYMTMRVHNADNIIILDSTGIASRIPISTISDMKLKDIGIQLERFFQVHGKVVSALIQPTEKELKKMDKDLFLVFLTKQGFVKKTRINEFFHINGSTTAIKLPANDELVAVNFVTDNTSKDMIIYTNLGNGIRRDINEFSVMKPNARGARQITIQEDEFCVGMDTVNPSKKHMFYLTSTGKMKLTEIKYLPSMKKNDDIVSLINLDKREYLVGIKSVNLSDTAVIYKKNSQPEEILIKDVPVLTRIAKAEKMIKLSKGDVVLGYTIKNSL